MRATIAASIRNMGATVTPDMFTDTIALMAPLARGVDDVAVDRDVVYGTHQRHRLDVFYPSSGNKGPCPAIIYVHGGGFVSGDKHVADTPFYDSIAAWAASIGALGVTLNYRLAPDYPWPAGAEDIARAIAFLRDEAHSYSNRIGPIFLIGQSAGAAHVATFVAMQDGQAGNQVAGAVMLSGLYDPSIFPANPMTDAYYAAAPDAHAGNSSVPGLLETSVPCLFSISELDPPEFQQQAAHIVSRWFERHGKLPRMLYLRHHNHMSPALSIGQADDGLTSEIEDFIKQFS